MTLVKRLGASALEIIGERNTGWLEARQGGERYRFDLTMATQIPISPVERVRVLSAR